MANILRGFDVSFGVSSLFVRAKISDLSSGSPVFVSDVVMVEDQPGTYVGTFSADPTKAYLVSKRVYTDGTFTTIDNGYSAASGILDIDEASSSASGISTCGLSVILSSSSLNVVLSQNQITAQLAQAQLLIEPMTSFLTVTFPCEG